MAGLYIHIPFCRQKCAYCDFPSWAGREGDTERYLDAVVQEARLWNDCFRIGGPGRAGRGLQPLLAHASGSPAPTDGGLGAKPPCSNNAPSPNPMGEGVGGEGYTTVFIGGGTPSLLPAGMLEKFMDFLRQILTIKPIEFTVEANPGTVDAEKLASFRRMGANRISFGVQAAQDGLLKRIGRIHTWADFIRSYNLARTEGFLNISCDMMTGLPGQTLQHVEDTARKLVALGPEHVSCYGLIVEDGTRLARDVETGAVTVPEDDDERGMFHAARAIFEDAGLKRYEISNFARPGLECLHNLNYWHNGNWLGLGCGAASHFSGWRRENQASLDPYLDSLDMGRWPPAEDHDIPADEVVFEDIMLGLRLVDGIEFARFAARHEFGFMERYAQQVEKLVQNGLMMRTRESVALTEKGLDLQNEVLMEFME